MFRKMYITICIIGMIVMMTSLVTALDLDSPSKDFGVAIENVIENIFYTNNTNSSNFWDDLDTPADITDFVRRDGTLDLTGDWNVDHFAINNLSQVLVEATTPIYYADGYNGVPSFIGRRSSSGTLGTQTSTSTGDVLAKFEGQGVVANLLPVFSGKMEIVQSGVDAFAPAKFIWSVEKGGGVTQMIAWLQNNGDLDVVGHLNGTDLYTNGTVGDLTNRYTWAELNLSVDYGNSTIARIGNCATGQVVQNTTTGGVECVNVTMDYGNPFDQELNTTSNVTFHNLTVNDISTSTVSSDLIPISDNAYDLGDSSPTLRWNDLFMGGLIYFDSIGATKLGLSGGDMKLASNVNFNYENKVYLTQAGDVNITTGKICDGTDCFSLTELNYTASNRSSVYAYRTTDQSVATSTTTTIIFTAEDFDVQGEYNTGTGKFTANEEGIYIASYSLSWENTNANKWYIDFFNSDGGTCRGQNRFRSSVAHTIVPKTQTAICQLDAGDTIYVQVWQDSGGNEIINTYNQREVGFYVAKVT